MRVDAPEIEITDRVLLQIARSKLGTVLRRERLATSDLDEPIHPMTDVDDALERVENTVFVDELLEIIQKELPKPLWRAFKAEFDGQAVEEVARQEHCGLRTIQRRLRSARERIAKIPEIIRFSAER
jgi:DNA-directed RNA polymerase specialized sigma24 family protein